MQITLFLLNYQLWLIPMAVINFFVLQPVKYGYTSFSFHFTQSTLNLLQVSITGRMWKGAFKNLREGGLNFKSSTN